MNILNMAKVCEYASRVEPERHWKQGDLVYLRPRYPPEGFFDDRPTEMPEPENELEFAQMCLEGLLLLAIDRDSLTRNERGDWRAYGDNHLPEEWFLKHFGVHWKDMMPPDYVYAYGDLTGVNDMAGYYTHECWNDAAEVGWERWPVVFAHWRRLRDHHLSG